MKPLLNDRGKPYTEVMEYDGYLFPGKLGRKGKTKVSEILADLNELSFEDDEVCIVSYPKSGTHWTYEICHMVKTGSSDFIDTLVPIFDYSSMEELKEVQATSRVYTSHLYPRHLPKQFMEKRCKIILVYRNPKDVAVSYFKYSKKLRLHDMEDMGFSEFLRHYISGNVWCGTWVKWMKEWKTFKEETPDYPLLEIAYEDMKKNPKESVQRISDFISVNSPPQFTDEIVEKCKFKVMAAHKHSNLPQNMEYLTAFENGHIFYRKGEVGDWKNHFTVAENEAFDKDMETILPKLGLNITYEL
ncbi:3-beta-hydroxysteroid sulfotransferase-like [Ostrea edulis]|uniref:3-beta-hydroxysteroid sulfotransferase-like n=1 Tax=Ostrea edulis TaxID=37623 RepID=UPI0024AF7B4D|nr:3-beta-hydroxysteroid sulfotransferase-like [Ostrea edulis]